MKKLTMYVELYEDIPVSDFEQLLLETGIEGIDCSYEIVEDSYEESYVREERFDNTFKVGDEVYIDKGSSLPRIIGKIIDIDGDAITISDGKFTYHPNISKVHLLNLESYKRESYDDLDLTPSQMKFRGMDSEELLDYYDSSMVHLSDRYDNTWKLIHELIREEILRRLD